MKWPAKAGVMPLDLDDSLIVDGLILFTIGLGMI
jgi:hypothetical protein